MPRSRLSVRSSSRIVARSDASTIDTGSPPLWGRAPPRAAAAGELVRKAAEGVLRPKTDPLQRLVDEPARLAARLGKAEATDRNHKDVVDPIKRVEDGERGLADG